jgi:hypothetical protein
VDEHERRSRARTGSNLLRSGHIRHLRCCILNSVFLRRICKPATNFRLNRAMLAVGLPRRGLCPNFLTTLVLG